MAQLSTPSSIAAFERRREREAQKRLRELERQAKEQAKLSALEQARLEVETYESRLEVLVSAHKEQSESIDWPGIRAALPPPPPVRNSYHEFRAKQQMAIRRAEKDDSAKAIAPARAQDDAMFQSAQTAHSEEVTQIERLRVLARRILVGSHDAYKEALAEFNPFTELSAFGSKLTFIVHSRSVLVCVLKVKGTDAIPSEAKTLTSGGKLSTKPMARSRFHELYQDCLCSYVIRVAREVFALLPVETLLITACADSSDLQTGQPVEQSVLSVAMPRTAVAALDFEHIDPSDTIETFLHRGDFKASRKSGAFMAISPLLPADIPQKDAVQGSQLSDMLTEVRTLRDELEQ